jgi:hypothetical protein
MNKKMKKINFESKMGLEFEFFFWNFELINFFF